jgi:hypothetical protein
LKKFNDPEFWRTEEVSMETGVLLKFMFPENWTGDDAEIVNTVSFIIMLPDICKNDDEMMEIGAFVTIVPVFWVNDENNIEIAEFVEIRPEFCKNEDIVRERVELVTMDPKFCTKEDEVNCIGWFVVIEPEFWMNFEPPLKAIGAFTRDKIPDICIIEEVNVKGVPVMIIVPPFWVIEELFSGSILEMVNVPAFCVMDDESMLTKDSNCVVPDDRIEEDIVIDMFDFTRKFPPEFIRDLVRYVTEGANVKWPWSKMEMILFWRLNVWVGAVILINPLDVNLEFKKVDCPLKIRLLPEGNVISPPDHTKVSFTMIFPPIDPTVFGSIERDPLLNRIVAPE